MGFNGMRRPPWSAWTLVLLGGLLLGCDPVQCFDDDDCLGHEWACIKGFCLSRSSLADVREPTDAPADAEVRDAPLDGGVDMRPDRPREDVGPDIIQDRDPELPCLSVVPVEVDFGIVDVDGPGDRREVTVANCGHVDLIIHDILLDPSGSPTFTLPGVQPPYPLTLSPESAIRVTILFDPVDAIFQEGALQILSNDAFNSQTNVPLWGRGLTCRSPIAVAMAESPVYPPYYVTLDGTASRDVYNKAITEYRWEILDYPEGSSEGPLFNGRPETSASQPLFMVDGAGLYLFRLAVKNECGSWNKAGEDPEDEVTVEAIITQDLHIQLVWNPQASDNDFDLHLKQANRDWFDHRWDCFYLWPQQDWGIRHDLSDNAYLDWDCITGCHGPENIVLNNPEDITYSVGVDYYSNHGNGSGNVVVRVYIHGILEATYGPKTMYRTKDFWHVADITFPLGEVRTVDQYFVDFSP